MNVKGNDKVGPRKWEESGVPWCEQVLAIIPIYCSVTRYRSSPYGPGLTARVVINLINPSSRQMLFSEMIWPGCRRWWHTGVYIRSQCSETTPESRGRDVVGGNSGRVPPSHQVTPGRDLPLFSYGRSLQSGLAWPEILRPETCLTVLQCYPVLPSVTQCYPVLLRCLAVFYPGWLQLSLLQSGVCCNARWVRQIDYIS